MDSDEYDGAKDAHDSYYAAVKELRRRFEMNELPAAKRVVHIGQCTLIDAALLIKQYTDEIEKLRAIKKAARSLVSRDDFWEHGNGIPGEYDDLVGALGEGE